MIKPNKPLKYEDLSVGTLVAMDYYITNNYSIYVVSDLGKLQMLTNGDVVIYVTLIDINSGKLSNLQFVKYHYILQTNIRISLDIDEFVLKKLHSNVKNLNKKIKYIEDFKNGNLKIGDIPKPKVAKEEKVKQKAKEKQKTFFKNDEFFKDYV